MGYMGFGLQKWIYTMRPRKPFSTERKASFTKLPVYSRTFKLQASENKGIYYDFSIVIFILLSIFVIVSVPFWFDHNRKVNQLYETQDQYAFNFLMKSGIWRFDKQNYNGAYSEFKLAYAIRPDDEKLNDYLFKTLNVLCLENNSYCEELDVLYFK